MNLKKYLVLALVAVSTSAVAGGDPASGKEKSATCVACHGENGMGIAPTFPSIAGQYEDYLYQSLRQYKAGTRSNPIMAGQVAALTDQDMKDLAAYYASMDGLKSLTID